MKKIIHIFHPSVKTDPLADRPRSSGRWRLILIPALFLVVALGVYGQALWFDLTYFDDHIWTRDYHWFLSDVKNIPYIFTHPDSMLSNIFYRPVLILSFMCDAIQSRMDPAVFHRTNIMIHGVGSFLVYVFLTRWGYRRNLSILGALIFLAHPVMTSAVVWIPGRTDSLLGVFVIAALIFFDIFEKSRRWPALAAHWIFWTFALLTKETAVVLPFMCFWRAALMASSDRKKIIRSPLVLGGWILIGAVWTILRLVITGGGAHGTPAQMASSIWANMSNLVSYAGKILIPVHLSVLPILKDTPVFDGWLALAIIAILFLVDRRARWGRVAWGAGWFVAFILPSLVFSFAAHEYRLYLPFLGALIVLVETGVLRRAFPDGDKKFWTGPFVAGLIIVILLAAMTIHRSQFYKGRMNFWLEAAQNAPHSALAHRNLGAMYFLDGDYLKSKASFEKARQLNPLEPMVHNNLGLIKMKQGDFRQAELFFLEEIRINPQYDNVYYNYGILLSNQGLWTEAILKWQMAIELNPHNSDAYRHIVKSALKIQNRPLAQRYVQKMIQLGMPLDPDFRNLFSAPEVK